MSFQLNNTAILSSGNAGLIENPACSSDYLADPLHIADEIFLGVRVLAEDPLEVLFEQVFEAVETLNGVIGKDTEAFGITAQDFVPEVNGSSLILPYLLELMDEKQFVFEVEHTLRSILRSTEQTILQIKSATGLSSEAIDTPCQRNVPQLVPACAAHPAYT